MMKLLLLCILLSGCEFTSMNSEEIAARLAECKKYDLTPDIYRTFGDGRIIDIQCAPKKGKVE